MEEKVMKDMRKALIKHFLDVIVMVTLRNQRPLSGYDVLELAHHRFDFLVSSGTVYSLLYSMEREGLVKGEFTDGKRVYALTEKGKSYVEELLRSKEGIVEYMRTLFES
jgi:DNA-binding PadR family transcriptional regulator